MGLTKPRAAQIYNLDYKQATRVVTVTNITLAGGAPSSVDGVSLTTGDRVLVTAQTTGSQNGIYKVTTVGSGANGTWARTTDADQTGEIEAGMIIMVTEGAIYADTQWKLITDDPITIGTTTLTFTQNYSANSISSGSSNVTVNANSNVTISSAGTPNVLTISSTGIVVAGTSSITGNITGGNLLTIGLISAAGNITGNYFLGNVACASGIYASRIFNGTSEANIPTSGGNANISIGGFSNVAVFASTGEYLQGILSVTGNIISAGNINTSGLISATGNITGGNLIVPGNGYIDITGPVAQVYTARIRGNTGGAQFGIATSNTASFGIANDSLNAAGTDYANLTYSANTLTFKTGSSATLANRVIIDSTGIVSVIGNITSGNILTSGLISATGNVTGNYFLGNVFYASGITASKIYNGTSEANVGTSGGNANISIGGTSNVVVFASTGEYVSGLLSVTGNITGGNIAATAANISTFIGNTFFGSVPAQPTYYNIAPLNLNNSLAAATKVQLNLINTGGGAGAGSAIDFYTYQISVAAANAESRIAAIDDGNYSAYLSLQTKTPGSTGTNGLVERVKIDSTGASVVANITGGNILTGGIMSSTGNATHGNILTGGLISATGNISGNNLVTNGNVTANSSISALGSIAATYNLTAGAYVSATGNVIGGNIISYGVTTSSGNITGGNLLTGGLISATANITGGNIITAGLVSATGNVTGGNILGNGASLTGILAFKTVAVSGGTQSNIVANSIASTLTFAAGTGLTWTTDPATGILTISTTSSGTSIFSTGGDMGLVTEAVTASEDLGNVTDVATVSYDLGSVVSASGLIYPSQLILPTYTPGTLPSASPAAQFIYLSTSSVGAMTAFSDGTNWRFTSTGAIVS
jgi:hypothetical protein